MFNNRGGLDVQRRRPEKGSQTPDERRAQRRGRAAEDYALNEIVLTAIERGSDPQLPLSRVMPTAMYLSIKQIRSLAVAKRATKARAPTLGRDATLASTASTTTSDE